MSSQTTTTFDLLIYAVNNTGNNKKALTYESSLSMAKITEKGIRLLENKIDIINSNHENIRTILIDDKESITSTHINSMNNITNSINNEHETQIMYVKKLENIRILDNIIDNTQKDISEMLDYCDNIIEKANLLLINICKKELYNRCVLKKLIYDK